MDTQYNIFYDFGKYTLRPESASELDRLFKLLKELFLITLLIINNYLYICLKYLSNKSYYHLCKFFLNFIDIYH